MSSNQNTPQSRIEHAINVCSEYGITEVHMLSWVPRPNNSPSLKIQSSNDFYGMIKGLKAVARNPTAKLSAEKKGEKILAGHFVQVNGTGQTLAIVILRDRMPAQAIQELGLSLLPTEKTKNKAAVSKRQKALAL